MTTETYLHIKLSKFGISQEQIQLIMVENNLDGNTDVDILKTKEAMYNNFSEWLPIHTQITEGGVTEQWDYKAISLYYGLLCKELGKENVLQRLEDKNEIKDKSNIW